MRRKNECYNKHKLIERITFGEYDILGFLMLIREHTRNGNPYILELADLIVHHARTRGQVLGAIKDAIDNNYETYDGKCVKYYNGISEVRWKSGFLRIGS